MSEVPFTENGVTYLTERREPFSNAYIKVRSKEQRVLLDPHVRELPFASSKNPLAKEWKLRQQSTQRFLNYLQSKKVNNVLDIGCGNGWFTNAIAEILEGEVHGVDINQNELEQAARVFEKDNLTFYYADIFKSEEHFKNKYDLISLNACVQYFDDLSVLLDLLKKFLTPKGEIHIMDSPFYESTEIKNAQKRTLDYYQKIGVPDMADYYFHHSTDILMDSEIMYTPKNGIFKRFMKTKDVPFYWIKISND